jgi:adenine phosphoribosyltransferase
MDKKLLELLTRPDGLFRRSGYIDYIDISRLLVNPDICRKFVNEVCQRYKHETTKILGIESMGFIFAGMIAQAMFLPLVICRGENKIFPEGITVTTKNLYRKQKFSLPKESISPGDRILIVDDIIASGSTTLSLISLIGEMNSNVVAAAYLIDFLYIHKKPELASLNYYTYLTIDEKEFSEIPIYCGTKKSRFHYRNWFRGA